MSDPETHDPYSSLRFPEYRWFLGGIFAFTVATQIQTLAMAMQVYHITHDPLSLGLIGLAEAIPFLGLTLVGGWAADRRDRRALSLVSMAVMLLGGVLLLALNAGRVPAAAWPFYAIQALAGLGRAFFRPSSQALATELVPREAYQNAATWRSSSFQLAQVTGPALGGLLYGFGSATLAYAVEVALMVFAVTMVLRVAPRPRTPAKSSIVQNLREGVMFVFTHNLVLGALTLDLFAVLFGGAVAMLPVFATDILRVGPQGFGIMRAAPAVGSVAMGFWQAHHPPRNRAGLVLLLCVACFGLCWVGFALSSVFWISLALLFASGAMDSVSMVLRGTLVQTRTPPEMMGRVQAVNGFFIGSSNELGSFESGLAARLLGVVPSVVFGGLMTLGVVGGIAWRVPELRRLKRITD
ncbi:MFS transporter [Mesoterricola silvestris]|uniref:Multidrug efflux pump Tap n=1 Tax=Mesoterricola silvestris TaxID=2927979 RepID=A0AA48GNR3_9BACT|nr:MFS transporter [Mesoterricola silvestris]BDU74787.1 MFS transporter [Mesoterricola silvestris]